MKSAQGAIAGATKEVIIELIPITDDHHLLIRLKDDKVVSPKKTTEKRASKKAVKEVGAGEKNDLSSRFDDVFDVNFSIPSPRNVRRSLILSPKFLGLQTCSLCYLTN